MTFAGALTGPGDSRLFPFNCFSPSSAFRFCFLKIVLPATEVIVSNNQLTSLSMLDRLQGPEKNRAWEIFVAIYQPFIATQLARAGVRAADIDDLMQESFALMYRALPQFCHNGNAGAFRKWLRTLVVRRALRYLHRRQKAPRDGPLYDQAIASFGATFEHSWEREHDRHLVNRLLEMVRPEFTDTTWTAFQLQVIHGNAARDVSRQLECTVNAALISKSRVLRRLREVGRGLIEC